MAVAGRHAASLRGGAAGRLMSAAARRRSVALILPVRNEERQVDYTLDAILKSTRLPDEMIIADGMSTDRTVERIEAFRGRGVDIKVIPNPKRFAGSGRNVAIGATQCEIIVCADFGNVLHPRYIEDMVRPFEESPDVDVVGCIFKPLVDGDFAHCVAAIHYADNIAFHRLSPEERVKLLPAALMPGGNSIAFLRRSWERADGFPEWLWKAQDKLFARKLFAQGARVAVTAEAEIHHHVRGTPFEVMHQMFFYGRGNGQSRYVTRHFIQLVGIYGAVLALALGGFAWPPLFAAAALLFGAYVYRAGIRRLLRVDGGVKKPRYLLLTPVALVARDLGVLGGHVVGWLQWIFVRRFRTLFWDYVRDCPRDRLPVVSR